MARRVKLEINHKLEQMRSKLDKSIAILNVPVAFHCEHKCNGCVSRKAGRKMLKKERNGALPRKEIRKIIDHFKDKYDTKFITVNGRGDPFHEEVVLDTLDRINYAHDHEIQAYIFTAGDSLNDMICSNLAGVDANVMISLFGNGFIDADFFTGKTYKTKGQTKRAENIRELIMRMKYPIKEPEEGLTRIGMNYVVKETDLADRNRLAELKEAANEHGIFFICNLNFFPHEDQEIQKKLQALAIENSDFNLVHSTAVDGVCQMGAGSSATISPDGLLYRCPYMMKGDNRSFLIMSEGEKEKKLDRYMNRRKYACVLRKTPVQK